MHKDLIVVGGGVIGLAVAVEAARRGWKVTLLERGRLGRESSWAAVGLLPYLNPETARHPLERFTAASHAMYPVWQQELLSLSGGVDSEFEMGGALYLARTRSEIASLHGLRQAWCDDRIPHECWDRATAARRVPALAEAIAHAERFESLWAPRDAQIRTPRLLQALAAAAVRLGVELLEGAVGVRLQRIGNRSIGVSVGQASPRGATAICLAAGAWTGDLLQPLEVALPLVPIRGQVLGYQLPVRPLVPCVYEAGLYLAPRRDGLLLLGSTLERVGFDRTVTAAAREQLAAFAASWLPACHQYPAVVHWSGLRPAAFDGFPYLGRVPGCDNLLVATGHFRSGVHLAPLTARLVLQLADGESPALDLHPFRIGRSAV